MDADGDARQGPGVTARLQHAIRREGQDERQGYDGHSAIVLGEGPVPRAF